jgi:replicative DNA helicase
MELPFYIQKAVDLGLMEVEDGKIVRVNRDAIDTTAAAARLVEKLQPTTIADKDDTTDQEAIVLCRILISPSGLARELWSKFRTAFGLGHGQEIPPHIWSNPCFRAIGKEIDMTFIGERTGSIISKNSLITGYEQMNPTNRDVTFSDFCQTISELTNEETMRAYGDQSTEWSTALDILKQKRALSFYKETIYLAGQSLKTDPKLEKAAEFINRRTMDIISMLSGSIGNQGQVVDLNDSIIGNPGGGRLNWTDYILNAEDQDRPTSTGITAFDIDIDGGVSAPRPNMPRAGRLLVIAARTGVGKTALGVQVAASLAKGGLTVGFVSVELDTRAIEARIIANLSRQFFGPFSWKNSGEDFGFVEVGELERPGTALNRQRIAEVVAETSFRLDQTGGKILVEAPWAADVDSVVNTMRAMKAKQPELRAIVIDHFHCLAEHKGASKMESVMLSERAYRLMTAAKELDVDLFVLAQLNRVGMDSNSNPEPQLNEIRGTDALAHVAHAAWIVRKTKVEGDNLRKDLEVWHSKVRGRQSVWSEGKKTLETINGFIDKSIIRMQYKASFVEGDTTTQLIKERQGLGL